MLQETYKPMKKIIWLESLVKVMDILEEYYIIFPMIQEDRLKMIGVDGIMIMDL